MKKHILGAAMLIAALVITSCGNKNGKNENNENDEIVTEETAPQREAKRLLIIVDPQVDFTTGSLAVANGPAAMETLAQALKGDALTNYTHIVVTQDFHPTDHSSFVENGGTWPAHCVQGTDGVNPYPALQEVLDVISETIKVEYLHKGDIAEKEEYSILQNEASGARIRQMLTDDGFTGVDICGIASDYCVFETLKDLISFYPKENVRVVTNCVAAVDESSNPLPAFLNENGIEAIEF